MSRAVNFGVDARSRGTDENMFLIKKFIKKTKKSGIIDKVKERRYYEKPSVKKRRKRANKKRKSQLLTDKHKQKHNY